ncbi:hypothetical protein AN640_08380 [Candidatus Epulonipiscium fishelsonii]|uniref:Uncharacterized protein n=1 Tax=Candidatus Epulonipiscium fishelsonii TaxID=77094 RepID=A0ACC8XD74_9FIRM|nr:hypothetical protein AN640_08380 [Epulopiscium sp. SCG-D08WGA-EpuloA1]OON95097.1 MAG: hypothetical protein ATN32_01300 [Epulopiscium sp. AS2M-Bin002]
MAETVKILKDIVNQAQVNIGGKKGALVSAPPITIVDGEPIKITKDIALADQVGYYEPGDKFDYEIVVTNLTDLVWSDFVIEDKLPTEFEMGTPTIDGKDVVGVKNDEQVYSIPVASIAAEGSLTIVIPIKVKSQEELFPAV